MHLLFSAMLVATVSAILLGTVQAQSQPKAEPQVEAQAYPPSAPALKADAGAGYRIEFLGKEPSADWAKVAGVLVENNLVPLETLQLRKGQDACSAVLEQLNFRSAGLGCSAELRALIRKLNPQLGSSSPVGAEVKYPKLPIEPMVWYAGFDRSLPGEADRYNKVNEAWKPFKAGEKARGSQAQIEFRGFRTHIAPSDDPQTMKTLESIERFDPKLQRFDIRIAPLSSTRLMKQQFSMTDNPVGWGELCRQNTRPSPPAPPYIALLGGTKEDLKCVNTCRTTDTCPEIVLIDQKVESHPDIAHAFIGGGSATASATVEWCPFEPFDSKKHHGTHLAGLMVSSGKSGGFVGLAPTAWLDNQDIGTLFDQNIKKIANEKNFNYTRQNVIFVFASQFPWSKDALAKSTLRYSRPPYVEDILGSLRLWIVAAGQQSEQQPEVLEIGVQTPTSPMNLGDRGTVLVVTACENCYSDQPTIASWANYSGSGLVNLAAPGGTDANPIPSLVTAQKYGLAYGTSQATALVGGLAAAMMACYPTAYNSQSLKTRLLTTARPPLTRDVAEKVSAGIVDASKALLDPYFHWVTRKSTGTQEKVKEVKWCKQELSLKDPEAPGDGDATITVDVRKIRRLVRNGSSVGSDTWSVFYQKGTNIGQTIRVATLATAAETLRPLLYFRQGPGTTAQQPIPIEEVVDLLVGLSPKATTEVPPDFIGCK